MATKRRSLEERILDREEKIQAEKAELDRLRTIQEMAAPRSEWIDKMYVTHDVKAELAKAHRMQGQLTTAVLKMAGELGIHAENDNAVWAQVRQRYGVQ